MPTGLNVWSSVATGNGSSARTTFNVRSAPFGFGTSSRASTNVSVTSSTFGG